MAGQIVCNERHGSPIQPLIKLHSGMNSDLRCVERLTGKNNYWQKNQYAIKRNGADCDLVRLRVISSGWGWLFL